MKYFGGIEGGATKSHLIICNEKGECCAEEVGPQTNHWAIGITQCAKRIADMVAKGKKKAGIPEDTPLDSLGLSLSGCEQEATNRELESELRTSFPNLSRNYVVCSDTLGSVFVASPHGGMVVISGTGSNTLLRNPDGQIYTCGGWGHLLGDEGSAFHVSHRAVKICFDDIDNMIKAPHSTTAVWDLVKEHFNAEKQADLLTHCYAKFDKTYFASLCKKLAILADVGDELAKHLFFEAGQHIARNISALLPKVHHDLVETGDLNIICVGSVWHSWNLLREGFNAYMQKIPSMPFGLRLVTVTKNMAYGACYLGVDHIGFPMPRNYSDNIELLYHFKAISNSKNNNNNRNGVATLSNGHC